MLLAAMPCRLVTPAVRRQGSPAVAVAKSTATMARYRYPGAAVLPVTQSREYVLFGDPQNARTMMCLAGMCATLLLLLYCVGSKSRTAGGCSTIALLWHACQNTAVVLLLLLLLLLS